MSKAVPHVPASPIRKTLLINSACNDHNRSGDYAMVGLDEEDIKTIARRKKMFEAAALEDTDLEYMAFDDGSAEFFEDLAFTSEGHPEKEDGTVWEASDLVEDSGDCFQLEPYFTCAIEEEEMESHVTRTDGQRMYIGPKGVWWRAHDHYGSDAFETAEVPYEKIFAGVL